MTVCMSIYESLSGILVRMFKTWQAPYVAAITDYLLCHKASKRMADEDNGSLSGLYIVSPKYRGNGDQA